MAKKDNHTDVLLEDIQSKFDAIIEIVVPTREEVALIKEDVTILKEDAAVIKAAVTRSNKKAIELDERVGRLEARTV